MANSHPTNQISRDTTSSRGGWTPSRGFWVGMGGVAAFAAVLALATVFAAVREPQAVSVSEPSSAPEPAQVSIAPKKTTPADDITGVARAIAGEAQVLSVVTPPGAGSVSLVESPKTVSSSWSMAPLPEEGDPNVITSGTSMSPVQQTSSATVLVVGD